MDKLVPQTVHPGILAGDLVYACGLRTGTDDRPEKWLAEVSIDWTITGYQGSTGTTVELDGVTPIPPRGSMRSALSALPVPATVTDHDP